ncbi:MAG: sensory histidine kinase AtoS [Methanocella sp. PtaU1.Bin125]|nr:MAG: sensory histidine kinase AtoS [Methanocella sp. PtaU1.Bin125]
MTQRNVPDDRKETGESPAGAMFESINSLRDRIAKLAQPDAGRGGELGLHWLLLEVLPSPVWVAAADGRCVFFNKGWLRYTGRTMEQELGDGWMEGVHPDDVAKVRAKFRDELQAREGISMEYRLRRHDGKYRNVVDLGQPFFDREGNLAGYIGSVFDFTERADAERQMKKAFHDLGERVKELTALNGFLDLYQRPGPIPDLLSEAVKLLPPAYQYPELVAARITYGEYAVTTPGFRETPWRQVAPFRADGRDGSIEVVYLEPRPAEDEGPFLKDERTLIDGLAKLTGAFINRRMAHQAAIRLASIVENSHDAIIGKTLEGIITDWNPAAERLYGYTAREAVGKSITITVPPERRGEVRDVLRKVGSGEKIAQFETQRVGKDGRPRDVSLTVSPIRDAEGRIVGASVIARDISERNRVRRELEDAKAQAELYLDLISHDINNMNQAGIGYLEIAIDTLPLNAEQRMLLERPLGALKGSSNLIDNVRKLQRLRSGELKSRPIDLCAIIADLVKHYGQIQGANVKIHNPPVEMCLVMADDLIRDVFSNLIDNAIKHADPGRPLEIGIGLSEAREAGREFYVVVVEDNGPGIADAIKYQLFRRFHRGKTRANGKGLGLYIVRMLVQSYEGRVWVEDRVPGDHTKGSRFVVMLPAVA